MSGTPTFGALLRHLRKRAKLSQGDVATHVNVTRQTISDWERDRYCPERKDHLRKLCRLLKPDTAERAQLQHAIRATHRPRQGPTTRALPPAGNPLPLPDQLLSALAALPGEDLGRQATHAIAQALGCPYPEMTIYDLQTRHDVDSYLNEQMPASGDRERLRLSPAARDRGRRYWSVADEQWCDYLLRALAEHYAAYATTLESAPLRSEEPTLKYVLDWALAHEEHRLAIALSSALARLWRDRGSTEPILELLRGRERYIEAAAGSPNLHDHRLWACELISILGHVHHHRGAFRSTEQLLQLALDLLHPLREPLVLADVLSQYARLLEDLGRLAEAEGLAQQALSLHSEERSNRAILAQGVDWSTLAGIALTRGDPLRAKDLIDTQSFHRRLETNHEHRGMAIDLRYLGQIALRTGDLDEAERRLADSLAISRKHGGLLDEGRTMGELGIVKLHRGDENGARACFAAAQKRAVELKDAVSEWLQYARLTALQARSGRPEEVAKAVGRYDLALRQVQEKIGHRPLEAAIRMEWGELLVKSGRDLDKGVLERRVAMALCADMGMRHLWDTTVSRRHAIEVVGEAPGGGAPGDISDSETPAG